MYRSECPQCGAVLVAYDTDEAAEAARHWHGPSRGAAMKRLPESELALFVRTDSSDAAAWEAVCREIQEPPEEDREAFAAFAAINAAFGQEMGPLQANVTLVDDPAFEGLTAEDLLARLPDGATHAVLFVVDGETAASPEHRVLVVDAGIEPGRTLRTLPAHVQAINDNLSIANMDWEDFAGAADDDGVFRGFPR